MCCNTLFIILRFLLVLIVVWCLLYYWVSNVSEKNAEKFKNFAFMLNIGFSVMSLAVPIIVILTSIFSISLAGKVSNTTDFYTAFIALCTAFVVGFQIYTSIDLNNRFEKLNVNKKELEEQIKKLEKQIRECEKLYKRSYYFNAYNVGAIYYNQSGIDLSEGEVRKRYCWNSLRAYFNALSISAEGGQDFSKAIRAFGGTRMIYCIQTLNEIHKEYKCGIDDGDDNTAMPKYEDRVHYITTIQTYISKIAKLSDFLDSLDSRSRYTYKKILAKWNEFLKVYYSDLL